MNGRKFTSADAKFMLDTLQKESVHGKNYLAPIESVQTPDDTTVVIKLRELMPDLPIYLLSPGWARAFPKECYEEKDCLTNKGIGTGPFVLKEFNPGTSFKFERFDKYFRKDRFGQQMPYLDGVVVLDMPDPATQIAAFRTGQIDNSSQGIITSAQFKAVLETNPKSQVVLFPGTCGGDTALFFNMEQKPFDDARVRQALSMAINREDMYMTVFQGLAISDVFLPETYLGYDMAPAWGDWPWKGKEYLQYNLEGAKKLLSDAGYPNGFKTKLNGTFPATCNLMNCRPAWEYVQAALKKVGVEAEFNVMQGPEYNTARLGRTWEGILAGISFPGNFTGDGYTYGNLNSKSSLNIWGPRAGQDAQLDDLTLKQRQTTNVEDRRKLWNQIVDRVSEQQYQVQLGIPLHFRVYQPWVKNMGDHNCGWRTGWSAHGAEEDWFSDDAPKRKL
ncbi:MAG: ABC transporter substrate-binding protein [Chloroflexi bacterium]|nr:ABC transporter substrate-binding protein [Chloroflexota bacterium]